MFDVRQTLTQSLHRLAEARQAALRLAESGATMAFDTSRELAKHNVAVATELGSAVAEESKKLVESERVATFARQQAETAAALTARWAERQEAWLAQVGDTAAQWAEAFQASGPDATESQPEPKSE